MRCLPILLAVLLWHDAALGAEYEQAEALEVMGLDSTRVPDATYIGSQACRECHAAAYEAWLGTGHARSWVFLGTPEGMEVAKRHMPDMVVSPTMGMMATVPRMAPCLACHATAADVVPEYRGAEFHLQEGVQCEACHGPGSMHIEHGLIVAGQRLQASRMEIPSEEGCRVCHKDDRPSHAWLGRPPFDYESARARIAHPTTKQDRWQLLREQPAAYLSVGLRTMLGHWFGT